MAKTISGVVSSISGKKTIAVRVERHKTHPILRKRYLDTKKFMVHDEKSEALVGDKVSFTECRPLSATKHHKLERILQRAELSKESLSALKVEAEVAAPKRTLKPVSEAKVEKPAKESKKS